MDLGLTGKRVFVGGGSAGLGLGAARALTEAGCVVAINGRDQERLDAAGEAIGAITVQGDVGDPDGVADVVERARAELGGIDIVIANAGGPPPGDFASTPLASYAPAIETNLLASVALCDAVVPEMRERGWGRIVAITSISVRQPIANLILSNTARAGLTAFLKTLATEIAGDGITVNSVQPGYHATDRLRSAVGGDTDALANTVPTGTVGDPDDFGSVVAFLCSEQAKFVTGAAVPVDGGQYAGLQ